jgi:hypothetical protein
VYYQSLDGETAFRLKNDQIIIEFDGNGMSLYGVTIGFCKYRPRKGSYNIDESTINNLILVFFDILISD